MEERVLTHGSIDAERWGAKIGLPHRSILSVVIVGVTTIGVSGVLVASNGNLFAALAFLAAVVVCIITLYRVQWGLYLFIGAVLCFDQFDIPDFTPITSKVEYFKNLKEISYLPSFGAAVLNPLEVQLLFVAAVWFGVLATKRNRSLIRIPNWGAMVLFYIGIIGFVVFGLQTGGDFLPALWEVRALFYFGALFALVPQIIQTKEDLHGLLWVCILSISFKALQAVYRFVRLGLSFRGIATLTNHEDPVFITTLIIFLLALVLFDAKTKQRLVLALLLFPLLMGFFAGQRRAAYAAVGPSIAAFVVLLPSKERWLLARGAFPFLLVLTLYAGAFWDSESKIASPVRLLKTALSNDKEEAGDRYYSNLYREYEKYDLATTLKTAPVFGIGFGHKYLQPIKLVPIPFPLRDYIPHDEVLWLVVKTGAVGYFLFWFFLDAFACYGASVFGRLNDPYLRAVCILAVVAVINQLVVSYYDLQLTYYRNMTYLGTLTGLVASLETIQSRLLPAGSGNTNR